MSRLLKNGKPYRETLIAKNEYGTDNEYQISHPNALSDGDGRGRGETSTIGTSIDIAQRNTLLAKNLYTKDNDYNISNA